MILVSILEKLKFTTMPGGVPVAAGK